jgi:hypothetical protein
MNCTDFFFAQDELMNTFTSLFRINKKAHLQISIEFNTNKKKEREML